MVWQFGGEIVQFFEKESFVLSENRYKKWHNILFDDWFLAFNKFIRREFICHQGRFVQHL